MSNADSDARIEAAILWDLPRLRRFKAADTDQFIRVMGLSPRELSKLQQERAPSEGTSPLALASDGLAAELIGENLSAKVAYTSLLDRGGLAPLLGALLLAWMPDAGVSDFRQAEVQIARSGLKPRVRASCSIRLAVWARNRGYGDIAERHYAEALRAARGELRGAIKASGVWFGRSRDSLGYLRSNLVAYPWIMEFESRSARAAAEESLKRKVRSPHTRRFSFGGPPQPIRDIAAAINQADWVGAAWLLPGLMRLQASLLLTQESVDPVNLRRAIGLWIRGGGSEPHRLFEVFERHFDNETASEILGNQLRLGALVPSYEDWVRICGSVWDQAPESLVSSLIEGLEIRDEWTSSGPHGLASESTSLLAVLAARAPSIWTQRFRGLSIPARCIVARSMATSVMMRLPDHVAEMLADACLGEDREKNLAPEWRSAGWDMLAALTVRLGGDWLAAFREQIPDSAVPLAAMTSGLLGEERIIRRLAQIEELLKVDRENWTSGHYLGRVVNPATDAARCVLALGIVRQSTIDLLLAHATDPRATSNQASSAMSALRSLYGASLVDLSVLAQVAADSRTAGGSRGPWEGDDDVRIEAAERATIAVLVGDQRLEFLLAASRDPSILVRRRGVALSVGLAATMPGSAMDSVLLGALYDQDPSVQAMAARAVVAGLVADGSISAIAWQRLVENWSRADRLVRASIAEAIGRNDVQTPEAKLLRGLAVSDRSAMVRLALDPTQAAAL